jgi:pimeloyl-ACP methyl ester carboxylesterase
MPDVTLADATTLHYELQGAGSPLLLLHGFTGSGSDWQYVFNEPLPDYQLIVPDLRGHGRSTNRSGPFTHRQSAQDILALLDTLGLSQVSAIGMSAGAKTLLHLATAQPARIKAMILVSAAPYFPPQARVVMNAMAPDGDGHSDEEWAIMRGRHLHGDDQIRALWGTGHGFKDSYEDMNFTPPLLSTITARTLIVHGDRDPLYPVPLALELYSAIPHSYLWVVPNGGHGPIFGEFRAPFVDAATSFLAGRWTAEQGG